MNALESGGLVFRVVHYLLLSFFAGPMSVLGSKAGLHPSGKSAGRLCRPKGGFHSEAGLYALHLIKLAILAGLSRWVTFGRLQKQDPRSPPVGLSLIHFSKS
jgi:hypothetical protein